MRNLIFICLIFFASCSASSSKRHAPQKVGLCIVATGKYLSLASQLIDSARHFFCKDQKVTYFLFTDGELPPASDVRIIPIKRIGWPYDSLKRFHIYDSHKDLLTEMDYVFAIDADMRFVAPVGTEILGKTVGVARDVGKHKTYEKNKRSQAYISKKQAKNYFAGAFYGGKRAQFFQLVNALKNQVDADLEWDYIAIYHDESHLNRYFAEHPPQVVLNTAYCYPQDWDMPYPQKILALTKNHKEFQTPHEVR